MNDLIAPLYFLTAVGVVALVLVQGLRRSVELLSIRNLYLAGFVVYQLISVARAITADGRTMFNVQTPVKTGTQMLGYALVFLAVFLFFYHKTYVWKWIARRTQVRPTVTPDSMLMVLALALVAIAVGARVSTNIPVLRSIAFHLSIGFAAVSCGIIGWVWANRRFNPVVIAVGGVVFAASLGIALYGSFGRRSLLAVGMGLAWGAYYRLGHRMSPAKLIVWSAPMVLATLVIVSAFSAIRGDTRGDSGSEKGLVDVVKSIANPSKVQTGTKDVLGGQACGSAAMWCMENYPTPFEPRGLFSIKQMGYQFIPRIWWPEKPMPLANELANLAKIEGVARDKITLPPGVLGYAAAEGGFVTLLIYAAFFGGFTRLFDEIVRLNRGDPFFVTACGCTTGHFLGLARGDLANFTINIVVAFVSTLLCIWMIRLVLGRPLEQRFVHFRAPTVAAS